MIAELVRQYDTLKKCKVGIPDPYFDEMPVWVEVILKPDGSFQVNWLGSPSNSAKNKKNAREEPYLDSDCPVTEKSACRSSGNDSPHGLVDNAMWMFGKFATEKQEIKKNQLSKQRKNGGGKGQKEKDPPDEARRKAYLNQLQEFYESCPGRLGEIKTVWNCLSCSDNREKIWTAIVERLKEKIVDGKGERVFEQDERKWRNVAAKANIRWVIERTGQAGKPVNALDDVKKEWKAFQEKKNEWWITSLVDGKRTPARILHPKIGGASLVSFNNVATYCGHLSPRYRGKPGEEEDDSGGSALLAQIGFEEAEKYSKALDWLIQNSSVKFGDTINCVWIDQGRSVNARLDTSATDIVKPQSERSVFKRGKVEADKGGVLADSGDLIKALERFRNGQNADYRDKRFYLLSLLLRRKGRHAILGRYTGTMGLLDDNAQRFVVRTEILIPSHYLAKKDEARKWSPTLMDILSAAGIKSEKKPRLIWDREVVEVIAAGRPLPADLCRLVVLKAVKDKHLEQSKTKRNDYLALLAIAAGCARHYLTGTMGKESYGMGLDTTISDPGYLAGRLFALCENVQKRGRNWGPTLSDKLFSSAVDLPRQTLMQLYRNCLCYQDRIHKKIDVRFAEIFDKISLEDGSARHGVIMPENGVNEFAFLLGYWHQRGELGPKEEVGDSAKNAQPKDNQ